MEVIKVIQTLYFIHKLSTTINFLSTGYPQANAPIIPHSVAGVKGFLKLKDKSKMRKVIMCSGKVYFDLLAAREKLKVDDVALYRIEQLYPFPAKALVKELRPFANNSNFYWCQEEPKNMGCLLYTSPSPRDS